MRYNQYGLMHGMIISHHCKKWNDWCTCKAILGRRQPGLMRWILLWIMPLVSIDRLPYWSAVQRATTVPRITPFQTSCTLMHLTLLLWNKQMRKKPRHYVVFDLGLIEHSVNFICFSWWTIIWWEITDQRQYTEVKERWREETESRHDNNTILHLGIVAYQNSSH